LTLFFIFGKLTGELYNSPVSFVLIFYREIVVIMEEPKGKKGQESRVRLLTAATSEFAQHGYYDTKVSMIVQRAELTQAAFYLYFPSKEAIFVELVKSFKQRAQELSVFARLQPGLSAEDVPCRIQQGMEEAFRFLDENRDLTRLVLLVAPDARQIKAELVMQVAANLRSEQQIGYIRANVDIEVVAECLVGMIERLTLRWLLVGERDPATLAVEAADVVIHGILAR
jgi:AcrR family transcriptional regulator